MGTLPSGWFHPSQDVATKLQDELARELPPAHPLAGTALEIYAWREGATDDVLVRHLQDADRFTIVHLSWSGRTEVNPAHPTIEYDGTFIGFLEFERETYRVE
jgi:hypothetical protein